MTSEVLLPSRLFLTQFLQLPLCVLGKWITLDNISDLWVTDAGGEVQGDEFVKERKGREQSERDRPLMKRRNSVV
jgi:hypothetical protein